MKAIPGFVGRKLDLERLQQHLQTVKDGRRGRLVSIRGRRQAGKSRLVTEFADRSGLPQLFFTAVRHATARQELDRFVDEAARSSLPGADSFRDVRVESWDAAFRLVAAALPQRPAIVVLDEFPWLVESDRTVEGSLQVAWDRVLEERPVLLVLIGSDIATMQALTTHGRPLFGRAKELVVNPFTVADTAALADIPDAATAVDAQLVTGGYPRLCLEWRGARDLRSFLRIQLVDESSDLVVTGRNILAAEFPSDLQARRVLTAIGAGSRTNKAIGDRAGVQSAPLARSLRALREDKRVIVADLPMSLRPAREPRYLVADPYLRFWLRFIEPRLGDIERGRPDLVLDRILASWSDYRGGAVEPLVRLSLERIARVDDRLRNAGAIGGYWTRTADVEVDLVGVDRWPDARAVSFVGSVKWRERSPFSTRDLSALAAQAARVPGAAGAPLVAVSRSGFTARDVIAYGPDELVRAWTN